MRTEKKTEEQKAKIIARIEKNLQRKVESFELAELRASIDVVKSLGLYPKSGMGTAWGLILFCRDENTGAKEIYFYYPATEGMFDFFFRQNSGDAPAEDQSLRLDCLEELKFELSKKTFFSFLNPDEKRTIFAGAKVGNQTVKFCFMLMDNRAAEVADRLNKVLSGKSQPSD